MLFRQRIVVSNKWGFTKLTREEYKQGLEKGNVIPDGSNVKIARAKGVLEEAPISLIKLAAGK